MIVANLACTLLVHVHLIECSRGTDKWVLEKQKARDQRRVSISIWLLLVFVRDNIGIPIHLCSQKNMASTRCSTHPSIPCCRKDTSTCLQSLLSLGSSRPRCPVVYLHIYVLINTNLPFPPHNKCSLYTSLRHRGCRQSDMIMISLGTGSMSPPLLPVVYMPVPFASVPFCAFVCPYRRKGQVLGRPISVGSTIVSGCPCILHWVAYLGNSYYFRPVLPAITTVQVLSTCLDSNRLKSSAVDPTLPLRGGHWLVDLST